MKHLGDITKISGYTAPIVDCVVGGSPCQDLSVAGKRAGLDGERSGLYMEQIRIVKEMRLQDERNGRSDDSIRPRYMVWENVPGAFSSNKGEDFRIVLEELAKVKDENAVIPMPDSGKWTNCGCIMGDGWSIAWRVLDAQFWGVPQRRRRIALVADFGGECAREILFEREGLRGYFTEGRTPWQAAPADAERSVGADDREGEIPYTLKIRSGVSVDSYGKAAGKGALIQKNLSATLGVNCGMSSGRNSVVTLEPGIASREGGHIYEDVSGTLRANAGDNQMAVAYGVVTKGNGDAFLAEERHTALTVGGGQAGQGYPCTMQPIAVATQQGGAEITENGVCPTITAAAGMSGNNQPWICQGLDAYNQALTGDKAKTLNSAASDADHVPCVVVDNIGGQNEYGRESDVAPCLKATHYKNPPCVVDSAGFCTEHSAKSRSIGFEEEVSPTLRAGVTPACVYSVENHPNDSRVKIDESGKVQALTGRMGTGGGNVPMVMEPFCKSRRAQTADDATTWKHAKVANTLNTFDQGEARANEIIVMATQQGGAEIAENLCPTITAAAGMSGNNQPVICLQGNGIDRSDTAGCNGKGWKDDTCYTLNTMDRPAVAYALDQQGGKGGANYAENVMPTLCSDSHGTPHAVAYGLDRASFNQGQNAKFDFEVSDKGINSPIVAKGPGAVCYSVDQGGGKSGVHIREGQAPTLTTTHDGAPAVCYWDGGQVTGTLTANNAGGNQRMPDKENFNCVITNQKTRYIVRRLTPLECERLQGYPDGWTDIGDWTDSNGKVHKTSDAQRYKCLGNSIALPPWKWILKRISACYERDATMASLFDGIGGFPYLWEQLNGKGSCLWASEIEEFPIAVTERRINNG